jgi:hypothetical protein
VVPAARPAPRRARVAVRVARVVPAAPAALIVRAGADVAVVVAAGADRVVPAVPAAAGRVRSTAASAP